MIAGLLAASAGAQSVQDGAVADIQAPQPDLNLSAAIDPSALNTRSITPNAASVPAGSMHVGRVWVTPVLIQKKGGGAVQVRAPGGAVTGARVSVRNGKDEDVRNLEDAKDPGDEQQIREILRQRQQQQQQVKDDGGADDVGSSQQAMSASSLMNAVQQQQSAQDSDKLQSIEQMQAKEKQVCRREPRNVFERIGGWFGAKYTEECRSSVRRRETARVAAVSALKVENTLYFINLSGRNETTVAIECRIRDRGEIITANISVPPLDYGEWTPPCACEKDYKFWCTLQSPEPIAAHAVQTHKSAAQETMEYVDFFLVR